MTAYLPPEVRARCSPRHERGRFKASRILDLAVAGDEVPATAEYDATLRAKGDTTWVRRPATIPRQGTLRFVNGATQNHFVALAKFRKGKDFGDWKAWVRKVSRGERAKPPVRFGIGLDSGVVSPSHESTFDYSLPKGSYVLLCFWPDATWTACRTPSWAWRAPSSWRPEAARLTRTRAPPGPGPGGASTSCPVSGGGRRRDGRAIRGVRPTRPRLPPGSRAVRRGTGPSSRGPRGRACGSGP